jgi:hypothetical protein
MNPQRFQRAKNARAAAPVVTVPQTPQPSPQNPRSVKLTGKHDPISFSIVESLPKIRHTTPKAAKTAELEPSQDTQSPAKNGASGWAFALMFAGAAALVAGLRGGI